jgi:signal transduction histidine kinase
MAQLLTYSVEAAETEQATQNIALATLKLGRRAAEAFAARDADATGSILEEAQSLSETMAALPISPLIQTEMIDAIGRWREGLSTTADGLRLQNDILQGMDATAEAMIRAAGAINDMFTGDADRIGRFVQTMLLLGAALGLLLGSGTAFFVARSITHPLKRLERHMRALAADPAGGMIREAARHDELGAMARAANFFVTEIGRRENELRQAKDATDVAMTELKEAQTSLIQAEKLASLGQLVAGVAHEINTPIGVALTTSTALTRDVARLDKQVKSGRVVRSDLQAILGRLNEGGGLIFANLTRAIDLIHSFKQVAADRASGEQRSFELRGWLQEVVTSLRPMLRKGGHRVEVECPDGIILTSYPGALAQVLTNLMMNAIIHAFPDGRTGTLRLTVRRPRPDCLTIVFADDGVGIADAHRAKVFDPFFTTGRDRGSTGLGLHIVHNLVTVTLQGRIELDSKPGQGTTFTIEMPVAVEQDQPKALVLSA